MIDDLRRLEDGAELRADVCVVGAGAAGIALAHRLLGTRTEVVVLERGGPRTTEESSAGEIVGMRPDALTAGRGSGLGGTTGLWAGQCLPAEPEAFAERPWVAHSGWPFPRAELEPLYRRAEAALQLEGEVYDERVWDAFGVARPPVEPRRVAHRFTVWCPEPHLGRLYRRRLAASSNVRVLLHAGATEIVTTPAGDRVDCVRAATPEGKAVRVRAETCVLCAGTVENARLLLASNAVHAAGIGNRHDVVGRFLQDHPNGHCATVGTDDPARLQRLYGMFYRGGVRYLPRLVLAPELQRSEEVLGCAAYPVFHFGEASGLEAARRVYRAARGRRRPPRLGRELAAMARDAPALAASAGRRVRHGRAAIAVPARVTLQTHAEQAPDPASRVTLTRRRDALGVPLPRVDWRLGELDRRTAAVMVEETGRQFRRLGLGGVRPEPWLAAGPPAGHLRDSYHQMGTTRMGTDPRTSVVDPDGGVHGVTGLFVTGASVFPVGGFANPTLTIVALAIRLGDRLEGRGRPGSPAGARR